MSEVFRMQGTIDVDTQQATTSLQQVSNQGQQAESRFASIGSGLQKVGATMTVVGAGITAGIGKIIGTSKEWGAEVAQQEFLYKNLDSSVQNFINIGAKQAESLGMTKQQYENNATALSNTLNLLGVSNNTIAENGTQWMNLCADMGAFADVPIDVALSDMKSALVGNFNALDKYGMSVNVATINSGEYAKSLGKTWDQMSNAEKAQAIMSEAMKQGANYTGLAKQEANDFGMKWNLCKQKIMEGAAAIGEKLLPVLVPLVEKIGNAAQKVADWANEHPKLTQTILLVVGAIGTLMVVVGPILGFIGTLMVVIPGIIALGAPVIAGIAGVVAAITTLIGVGIALVSNWGTIKAKCSEVWNGIKSAIMNPIEIAKGAVQKAMSAIKSAVNVLLKPKLKLPHISVSGKFSLNPPSVPKIGVAWYAKGGIMKNPTMFGMNGNTAMIGGEAGDEAILPLNGFYDTLDKKLNSLNKETINYEKMTECFIKALTKVDSGIYMDGSLVGIQTAVAVKEKNDKTEIRNMRLRGELDYV